jgi:hypothetical protein
MPGQGDNGGQSGQVIADQNRVGGLQRQVGAPAAHGHAQIGGRHGGCVVDAVPGQQHPAVA